MQAIPSRYEVSAAAGIMPDEDSPEFPHTEGTGQDPGTTAAQIIIPSNSEGLWRRMMALKAQEGCRLPRVSLSALPPCCPCVANQSGISMI